MFDAILDATEPCTGDNAHDPEPYCTTCGMPVGVFTAYGNSWRHYQGEGTAASRAVPYEAGHTPAVGWRLPEQTSTPPAR
jgi:hypothetical protein